MHMRGDFLGISVGPPGSKKRATGAPPSVPSEKGMGRKKREKNLGKCARPEEGQERPARARATRRVASGGCPGAGTVRG